MPGLPRLPGTQQLAIQAAAKQLAPYVQNNTPVRLDWNSTYPTVPQLPGRAFRPASGNEGGMFSQRVATQLAHSENGIINLPPGDYALPIRVYCTDIHRHAHQPENYLLGPLRGARAGVLTALYSKVGAARAPYRSGQFLSWTLQPARSKHALTNFGELPGSGASAVVALFDSGFAVVRQRARTDGRVGTNTPNLPKRAGQHSCECFELRCVERVARAARSQWRRTMQSVPWSEIAPNIYMRSPSTGDFGSVGELDVRVTGSAGQNVPVPIESQILYPPGCPNCQPLTYNPEPTQPSGEDGGGGIPG